MTGPDAVLIFFMGFACGIIAVALFAGFMIWRDQRKHP